jgi:hypothetical protein
MATRRPDSVSDEDTHYAGYNCVACVAAVLYNETRPRGAATANSVAMRYDIRPNRNLDVNRAISIITDFTGLVPTPGRSHPWDPAAPDGHYAVFCLGRRHVIYGHRGPGNRFYLYDPQLEQDQDWGTLQTAGYAPFQSVHFGA